MKRKQGYGHPSDIPIKRRSPASPINNTLMVHKASSASVPLKELESKGQNALVIEKIDCLFFSDRQPTSVILVFALVPKAIPGILHGALSDTSRLQKRYHHSARIMRNHHARYLVQLPAKLSGT